MRVAGGLALLLLLLGAPSGAEEVVVDGVDAVEAGPTVEERLAEIRRRIQAAVRYPPGARRHGLEGVARVGFEIDRQDGRAREIRVVDSSGHPTLDRAAERGVGGAGTLPWVHGRLEVPVRFNLQARR